MPENTPRVRIRERVRRASPLGSVAPLPIDPSTAQPTVRGYRTASGEAAKAAPNKSAVPAPAPANAKLPIASTTAGRLAPSYEVGYRKPPKTTQFQPGHSGNPKGRPKKHFTIAGALEAELNAKHPITINGRAMHLTQAQIVAKQMCKKAMAGDPRATALIMKLEPVQLRKAFVTEPRPSIEAFGRGDHADVATSDAPFSEAERAMLEWYLSTNDYGGGDLSAKAQDPGLNAIDVSITGSSSLDVRGDHSGADDDDADQQTGMMTQSGSARTRAP